MENEPKRVRVKCTECFEEFLTETDMVLPVTVEFARFENPRGDHAGSSTAVINWQDGRRFGLRVLSSSRDASDYLRKCAAWTMFYLATSDADPTWYGEAEPLCVFAEGEDMRNSTWAPKR